MTLVTRTTNKAVVLVHGLGSSRLVMWLLARRLQRRGLRVVNWGYNSTRGTLQQHGRNLYCELESLVADDSVKEVHLVTHSMGGIVARTALTYGTPAKVRRMVMLCPPNRGSRVASFFGPWLRPLCKTIDQLATRPDSYVNSLPLPERLEVGIIAAAYDGLVPMASTYLGNERDHLVWPNTMHSGVLFRPGVAEQIANFISQGEFVRTRLAMSA